MLRRFFARSKPASQRRSTTLVEPLENRQLMVATVTNVIADNRGEVTISLSQAVTGVDKTSVRMTTSGPDAIPGNADDVRVPGSVRLSGTRIIIRAAAGAVESNASYIVRLDAKKIKAADGSGGLDGEFTGTLPSGDGNSGGNFVFRTVRDRGETPRLRMSTSEGVINLRMRKDAAPISATQFIDIANSGEYDGMFFTRSVAGFVVQGGALQITGSGTTASDVEGNTATDFPEELPRVLSNLRGTLSFARGGGGLASNQFFFNLGNNDATSAFNNLDIDTDVPNDSVFTPFAEVADAGGLAVMDAIAAKPAANLDSQIGTLGSQFGAGTNAVPVNDQAQAEAGLNPNRDLIVVRRVAARMKLAAVA
jgi:cyclophilin family peptidyl-prolyl cis-trans isomerase